MLLLYVIAYSIKDNFDLNTLGIWHQAFKINKIHWEIIGGIWRNLTGKLLANLKVKRAVSVCGFNFPVPPTKHKAHPGGGFFVLITIRRQ